MRNLTLVLGTGAAWAQTPPRSLTGDEGKAARDSMRRQWQARRQDTAS